MNTTGWLKGLGVTADGTGIVSHAGPTLADNTGLTGHWRRDVCWRMAGDGCRRTWRARLATA